MAGGNPHPFGSAAWKKHNEEEVANRPTTHKGPRAPITPEEFERYQREGMPKE
jgi:hypothetical protein